MKWLAKLFGKGDSSQAREAISRKTTVPENWASSQPHIAVLHRFLRMRDATDAVPEYWASMLKGHPQSVVAGLAELGLLEPASLAETVEFCHTSTDLKRLLSERKLKVSGKKSEQAARLIEADADGMEQLCGRRKIMRCSAIAVQAVENWLSEQASAFDQATDSVIEALKSRDFKTALKIADDYKDTRFHTPHHPDQEAMTIKISPKPLKERENDIASIFKMRPQILKGMQSHEWEGLYLNYAVWQLIGREAPDKCMPGFVGVGAMGARTVTLMLDFFRKHQHEVSKWQELGFKRATISCCRSGSCDTCIGLDKKSYRLNQLPELPFKDCTCSLGCRCIALVDVEF